MSESKEPPRLPDVVDEAGDSPKWLPWLGLALLGLVALGLVAREALRPTDDDAAPAAEQPTGEEPAAAGAPAPDLAK